MASIGLDNVTMDRDRYSRAVDETDKLSKIAVSRMKKNCSTSDRGAPTENALGARARVLECTVAELELSSR